MGAVRCQPQHGGSLPRSATIAITRNDGGLIGTDVNAGINSDSDRQLMDMEEGRKCMEQARISPWG